MTVRKKGKAKVMVVALDTKTIEAQETDGEHVRRVSLSDISGRKKTEKNLDFFFGKIGVADEGENRLPSVIMLDLKLTKVAFNQFVEAVRQLGLYWLVLNEIPHKDTALYA